MPEPIVLLTADELMRLPSDLHCELIDGIVVETSPLGMAGGAAAAHLIGLLGSYERSHNRGYVLGACGYIVRRSPDTVRTATVSFLARVGGPPHKFGWGYPSEPPDLVAHVVTPAETPAEIEGSVRDWVEFGARLVWVAYPDDRTVHVIHSLQERFVLTEGDTLDGGDVLPGFSCSMSELFG